MPLFLIKSLLSLALLASAVAAAAAMLEALGRNERTWSTEGLRKFHKLLGSLFLILFISVSAICISYLVRDHSELSARVTVHIVLALSILALFMLKVSYTRRYRQFYGQVRVIGIVMTLMTFVMVWISGGYYLAASGLGTHRLVPHSEPGQGGTRPQAGEEGQSPVSPLQDQARAARGRTLFEEKCAFCHDAHSTMVLVGPGLKGVLKAETLPATGLPATSESIRKQIRQPVGKMPPFDYLSDEEITDLLAFMRTL